MNDDHHPADDPRHSDYWQALIPPPDAADFLGFTGRALANWRSRGGGPRFIRVGSRAVRYRRADLRAWAEARLRTSTADSGHRDGAGE